MRVCRKLGCPLSTFAPRALFPSPSYQALVGRFGRKDKKRRSFFFLSSASFSCETRILLGVTPVLCQFDPTISSSGPKRRERPRAALPSHRDRLLFFRVSGGAMLDQPQHPKSGAPRSPARALEPRCPPASLPRLPSSSPRTPLTPRMATIQSLPPETLLRILQLAGEHDSEALHKHTAAHSGLPRRSKLEGTGPVFHVVSAAHRLPRAAGANNGEPELWEVPVGRGQAADKRGGDGRKGARKAERNRTSLLGDAGAPLSQACDVGWLSLPSFRRAYCRQTALPRLVLTFRMQA